MRWRSTPLVLRHNLVAHLVLLMTIVKAAQFAWLGQRQRLLVLHGHVVFLSEWDDVLVVLLNPFLHLDHHALGVEKALLVHEHLLDGARVVVRLPDWELVSLNKRVARIGNYNATIFNY